jgi:hypothetical protein
MKKILFLIVALSATLRVAADDTIAVSLSDTLAPASIDSVTPAARPNLLADMTGVEVLQDSSVAILLGEAMNGKRELVEVDGYRVQIYSSNRQQEAKSEALELEEKLKDNIGQTIYVQYVTPFWKVRIGDFRTYDEAKEYKKIFVQQYPHMMGDTYIVRDKILVLQ